jgi:sporulation protein YlmC with PRC-barrel domain
MLVNTKDMIGVPVHTKSGEHVGKVANFDLDVLTGHLQTMHVKTKGIMAGVMSEDIMVPWDAIIEMSAEKVVVRDGVVPIKGGALADGLAVPSAGPSSSVMASEHCRNV